MNSVLYSKNMEILYFANRDMSLENYQIADSTIKIAPCAFKNCANLCLLQLNKNLLFICDFAFYNTPFKQCDMQYDSRLAEIGHYAFSKTKIEFLSISSTSNDIYIGTNCFAYSDLNQVKLSASNIMNIIGSGEFRNTKLIEFTWPENVTTIIEKVLKNSTLERFSYDFPIY